MRKPSILILTALVLCATLLPALAADSPAVLGILEIRGLDSLSASVFDLTKAAGQPMPKEAVSMVLYGALGTMPGMGIQPDGTVRALWLDNGTDEGGMAVLLPVENDGADYLSGLGQAGWKNEAETADGIEHFTPPEGAGISWPEVYFLKRGATLVAAPNADEVRKAAAALATLPPILPVEGDVAFQIHPAAVAELFSPQIQEGMDKAFKSNPQAPPEAAAMGELYARGYVAFAKQLDVFALGLGVADGHLNIHTRVAPVEGTTLAKWLATVKSPAAAASVVNVPGALFAQTANMGDLALIGPAYFLYMEELLKIMPQQPSDDFMKTYLDNAKIYWEQLGGDIGVAVMPPTKDNPLRAVEYVALKDSTSLRALVQKMAQDASEMMKAMAGDANVPVPVKLDLTTGEPREYRGIAVDTLTYSLTPGEAIAASWPKVIPTTFGIEMAWVPGGVLVSVGDPSLTDTLVDRALDGSAAPISDLPAWKAAYPNPDDNLVDLSHVALFDALRSYLELADAQTGESLAENIPAGSGNLESTSYLALGGVMSRIRFSLADIGAIGQKVKEAQEKAMAAMMLQMQGQMEIEADGETESMGAFEPEQGNAGVDAVETAPAAEQEDAPAAEAPAPAELE